jgi:primosomal protein N' (replication factor Y)
MVGPAEPVVNRIRNQYLMELVLKLPKDAHLLHQAKEMILAQAVHLHNHAKFKSVVMIADVDKV